MTNYERVKIQWLLQNLRPRDRELIEAVMEHHPSLSINEALEALRYFGA